MTDEELIKQFVAYQNTHAVEEYTLYGWHVWPVLRNTFVGSNLQGLAFPGGFRNAPESHFARYWRLVNELAHLGIDQLKIQLMKIGSSSAKRTATGAPASLGNSVVVLTPSNRNRLNARTYYNTIADPVVEALLPMKAAGQTATTAPSQTTIGGI